ncbi:MAG: hypothetical protein ABSE27_09685 [Acidobacteriaceae bacterium]
MIDLYAVQFEADELNISAARKRVQTTIDLVENWIVSAYRRQFGVSLSIPKDDFSLDLQNERLISRSTEQTVDSSCSIIKFIFTYPSRPDGNLLWTARINITHFRELLDFSMRLGIDSSQFVIAPVDLKLGRPQLIPTLLASEPWTLGGTRVSSLPILIQTTEVEAFVSERLLSTQRRLPIILISRVAEDDTALVDSRDVANHLAGIAEVFELADKWASYKLTYLIGRDHACFNGAIRVYWPKGTKTISTYCPVILPHEIRTEKSGNIRAQLFKQLSQISALRFIDGPITIDALEAIDLERKEKIRLEKEAARVAGNTDELIAIAEEEVRELRQSNDRLKKESDQLRLEKSLLAADLRTTQDNFRAVYSPSIPNAEPQVDSFLSSPTPDTVFDAVTEASEMYPKTLVFHSKALQSAKDSPYLAPDDVRYALLAMHEVCLMLQTSRKNHKPIGLLEDLFAEKGFTYIAHESYTSMSGKMGDERRLLHDGKKVSLVKHLALGKGGPDTCLRIYFYDDETDGKFVIGHVGRHKTNTKT